MHKVFSKILTFRNVDVVLVVVIIIEGDSFPSEAIHLERRRIEKAKFSRF